eukprot:jgi/Mesvir1/13573/Mv25012-RA.1
MASALLHAPQYVQLRRTNVKEDVLGSFARKARVSRGTCQRSSRTVVRMAADLPGKRELIFPNQYCESIFQTVRRPTRTIMVGNVAIGSEHPIRVQTMTTSDTKDVKKTVDEVMRCADAGAEIVRITVQGKKEADVCPEIKERLLKHGYSTPLVADIHFAPSIALRVADSFDKIRINPGNFADRRAQFEQLVYDDAAYAAELEHIEEVFTPLVEKCKKLGRAMRIGTNHGSLSDRIMSFYGDSPAGMVESAVEFANICRKNDFHNFLFSMKASNTIIMVEGYRSLAKRMYELGWDYPLHLGVTEAGEGEDGRMKSSIGIGALLWDGLGDTIRVSLTEASELEIDPCKRLANLGMDACKRKAGVPKFTEKHRTYLEFNKRKGDLPVQKEGDALDYRGVLHRDGSVLMKVTPEMLKNPERMYRDMGCKLVVGMPFKDQAAVDSIVLEEIPAQNDVEARRALKRIQEVSIGVLAPIGKLLANPLPNAIALATLAEANDIAKLPKGSRVAFTLDGTETAAQLAALKQHEHVMILFCIRHDISRVHASRRLFEDLAELKVTSPVIHHIKFKNVAHKDDLVMGAGAAIGCLLVDGQGDGVFMEVEGEHELNNFTFLKNTAFGLLQGSRMRNTKTEFVSCPSCGRTLFDLQEVTAQIRSRTDHLPGVSIAIMGCIVNGPGEMADADFGYVGGVPGKIDLYVGKTVVQRNIPMEEATEALVNLIKEHGRWVEPEPKEEPAAATAGAK